MNRTEKKGIKAKTLVGNVSVNNAYTKACGGHQKRTLGAPRNPESLRQVCMATMHFWYPSPSNESLLRDGKVCWMGQLINRHLLAATLMPSNPSNTV